jgi:DNA repair protein RadC
MAKRKSKGILTWPEDDRPRERLLKHGAQVLTEAELVAILIRVGCHGTNAVELGRQIIKRFGSLRAMMEAPLSALQEIKGLGGAKAAQLSAALEIGRRAALPDSREKVTLRKPEAVVEYLTTRLHGLPDEHFRGLYLNRKSVLIEDALLAAGTVDQVRPAIRHFECLEASRAKRKGINKRLRYFRSHQARMQYQLYRREGWPIGSGEVEGACKSLIKQRTDLSGQRWSPDGALNVLWVRALVKDGLHDLYWNTPRNRSQHQQAA